MNIYLTSILIFILTAASMKFLIKVLLSKNIVALPNDRSNHDAATPSGGGVVIISAIIIGFLMSSTIDYEIASLLIACFILLITGFIDDIISLSVTIRLIIQIAVTMLVVANLSETDLILSNYIPIYLEKTLISLALVYFMNGFNFMDGIDGIAASEAAYIGVSILILSLFILIPKEVSHLCLLVIAANLGFLIWNWHKAKIFMGDSGSIPLGFLLGWLLLKVALSGALAAAVIIPLYFLADSFVTLVRRLLRGERIWEAHSSHFFQIAVRKGLSHNMVVKKIALCNMILGSCAILSLTHYFLAIIIAIIVTFAIASYFVRL